MPDLQSEQEYLMGRWRQSNYAGDDFLKKDQVGKRYGAQGYEFDPETGTFFHPDAHLANVDPDTIQSTAQRAKAIAIQQQLKLTRPGVTQAPGNIQGASSTTPGNPIGIAGDNPRGGLTPEATWRSTFGPKLQSVSAFDPVKDLKTWQADTALYNKNAGNEVFRAGEGGPLAPSVALKTPVPDITKYKPGYQPPGAPRGDADLSDDEKKRMIQQGVLRYRDNILELNPNFSYGR